MAKTSKFKRGRSGKSPLPASKTEKTAFDPAKATAEELSFKSMDEMFALYMKSKATDKAGGTVQAARRRPASRPSPKPDIIPVEQHKSSGGSRRKVPKKTGSEFDPALATTDEIASRSMDEMFDLSQKALKASLEKDVKFEATRAAITTAAPVRAADLKASTVLSSRVPVIAYARYSDDQQNPLSIDDQFAEVRRYCDAMGYEIINYCSDAAMTGQTLVGRDGWELVEKLVSTRVASIVVAESLDRITRSPIDLLMIMEKFRLSQAFIDTPSTGRVSELQGLIHSIYNFLFKSMLVEKMHRGMTGGVRRGRHPGGTNYALKLKRNVKDPAKDEYVPFKKEAKIYFRIMWEIGVLRRSYDEIGGDLNAEGIPAPRGGLWTRQNFVHSNGLAGLAVNKRCVGIIVWNKASYKKSRTGKVTVTKNDPSEHVIGFNAKQAFIPHWLFRLVQEEAALRMVGPLGPRAASARRILTNLLKCGACGKGMHIVAGDSKGRPRVGCSTIKAKGKCTNRRTFYLDTIELMVARAMSEFMSTPGLVETTFDATVKEVEAHRKELMRELKTITAEKDGLQPMTVDLIRKMAAAEVDPDMLKSIIETNLKPLYHQKEEIERRIREIQLMLASDKLAPKKLKDATNVFASLERLLEETGGKKLPKELIVSAQALIGKVSIFPDLESRHFELRIAGQFDSVLNENYMKSATVISSQNYKNAKMEGPLNPSKLTMAKPFYITVSSATEVIPVDVEVRERPVRKFVLARRRTGRIAGLRPYKPELPGAARPAAVGSARKS